MKRSKIVFTASVDLDGDCTFDIDITRPDVKAHAYFYGYADTFIDFGNKLKTFPRDVTETVCFEWGDVGNPSSFGYLRIEAYCASPAGHTALRIIVDNNGERAGYHRFEFSIASEAASINKLGALLTNWQVESTPQLVWKAETR